MALSIDPDCPNAWLIKGTILMAGDKFREALNCFEHAQRLGNAMAANGIEICRELLGEPASPSQVSSESTLSASATVWFYRSEDLDKRGQSVGTLACFEWALAMALGSAYTWAKALFWGSWDVRRRSLQVMTKHCRSTPAFLMPGSIRELPWEKRAGFAKRWRVS